MHDLAVMLSAGLGAACLLAVCAVYLRKQSLGWGGALLSLCGLALLGLSYWQAGASDRTAPVLVTRLNAVSAALGRLETQVAGMVERQAGAEARAASDLALRLGTIGAALGRLEAQMAQIVNQQAEHAVAASTSSAGRDDAKLRTESAQRTVQHDHALPSNRLEIGVVGGVTDAELAEIVAWIRKVKAEHRSSRISIEPVMPLQSADPGGERTRLIGEAGRVIDHVFAAISQRVDIGSLVSEDVPEPILRLRFSEA
jgi:hypothetical protein